MIHVVAAAVTGPDGRVLIAQRPAGKHLAGSWEFPGGKLETGESRPEALSRELREELGIVIRDPRPLIRLNHSYTFGDILIDTWVVTRYTGEPRGLDDQALRWCTLEELGAADMLPADRPILRVLYLPEELRLSVTPNYRVVGMSDFMARSRKDDPSLLGALCADPKVALSAAGAGADFVVMEATLDERQVEALCGQISVPVYVRGLSMTEAWRRGASGLSRLSRA